MSEAASIGSDVSLEKSRFHRWASSPWFWALLLTLGLAVRCRQYFHAHSFWYDEAFLVLTVRERSYPDLLGPQPYNLVNPPAYAWLERGAYDLWGDNELSMRATAFLAGILALLVMLPLARALVQAPHAIWAFALLAGSRHAIAHGCEVRSYTLDLLCTELILLFTAGLILSSSRQRQQLYTAGLFSLAILAPWLSFPSAFVLVSASVALAAWAWANRSSQQWLTWGAFNALCATSGLLLWWFHSRHLYYSGMIEHWGHDGWGGFPNWKSVSHVITWTLGRPIHIGNYGSRSLGIILYLLAIPGAVVLGKRSRPLLVLVLGPYLVSLFAALVGKYPLAHRTSLFLLPTMWILAANGVDALVRWGRKHRRDLMVIGFLLIAWDSFWMGKRLVTPESSVDYRGAYAYVEKRRQPEEALWSQLEVVYQTYYGKDRPLVGPLQNAEKLAGKQRLWLVFSKWNRDILDRLVRAGGRPVEIHREFEGLWVVLLHPKDHDGMD